MMDGVPGVRAGDGCGRSFFPGRPPAQRVAAGGSQELAASINCNVGKARTFGISGGLPDRLGWAERDLTEFTQGVIAAAQDFAFDRQGWVLAILAVVLER